MTDKPSRERLDILELKVNALIWATGVLLALRFLDPVWHWGPFLFP